MNKQEKTADVQIQLEPTGEQQRYSHDNIDQNDGWEQILDGDSGYFYWYNNYTGESGGSKLEY